MGNRSTTPAMASRSTTDLKEQLVEAEALITYAILTDPHNELDYDDSEINNQAKVIGVIEAMRLKGYRPITSKEFLYDQQQLLSNRGIGKNVTLWRPLSLDTPDKSLDNSTISSKRSNKLAAVEDSLKKLRRHKK